MVSMISQQHIIIQIIFTITWILAVSLTTFIAFVSVAIWLGERQSDEDTFEDVINREFEKIITTTNTFVVDCSIYLHFMLDNCIITGCFSTI